MKDRLGKDLKIGAMIEIFLPANLYTAWVTEVSELSIHVPGQASAPPTVMVNIPIPVRSKDGIYAAAPIYVIKDVTPEAPVEMPTQSSEKVQ